MCYMLHVYVEVRGQPSGISFLLPPGQLGIGLRLSGLRDNSLSLTLPPCPNQPFYSATLPQLLYRLPLHPNDLSHRSEQAAISGSL